MNLLEFEGVKVVGQGIVCGILEIWKLLVCYLHGYVYVESGDEVPESECTAIFSVADILAKDCFRAMGSSGCMAVKVCSSSHVEGARLMMEDTFPKGGRGGDKGPPARGSGAGSFHHQTSTLTSAPPHPCSACILSTIDKMAEPIVQTIHRDPAMLYVQCAGRGQSTALTR